MRASRREMERNLRTMAKLPGEQYPEYARWSPRPSGPGPSFARKSRKQGRRSKR